MENCLVTKLNGSIGNQNLPKLGEIIFPVIAISGGTPSAANLRFNFKNNKNIKLSVDGSGYFSETFEGLEDPSLRLTEKIYGPSSSGTTIYLKNDNYNLIIEGKYNLTYLYTYADGTAGIPSKTVVDFDFANMSYLSSLTNVVFNYSKGRVHGDIANLATCENLIEIGCANDGGLVFGDIKSIAYNLKIKILMIYSTGIKGSIEDFVAGQVAQGITTPDTPVSARGLISVLTFGGSIQSNNTTSASLTWEGISKIVYGIGSSSSIGQCNTLYVKGATAEEIAAWQAAGKTVTDVTTGTVYPPAN